MTARKALHHYRLLLPPGAHPYPTMEELVDAVRHGSGCLRTLHERDVAVVTPSEYRRLIELRSDNEHVARFYGAVLPPRSRGGKLLAGATSREKRQEVVSLLRASLDRAAGAWKLKRSDCDSGPWCESAGEVVRLSGKTLKRLPQEQDVIFVERGESRRLDEMEPSAIQVALLWHARGDLSPFPTAPAARTRAVIRLRLLDETA